MALLTQAVHSGLVSMAPADSIRKHRTTSVDTFANPCFDDGQAADGGAVPSQDPPRRQSHRRGAGARQLQHTQTGAALRCEDDAADSRHPSHAADHCHDHRPPQVRPRQGCADHSAFNSQPAVCRR